MKHIATTNENEVIVTLNMAEINTLMMIANSASLRYDQQMRTDLDPEGRKIQRNEADRWWRKLYDLRNELI